MIRAFFKGSTVLREKLKRDVRARFIITIAILTFSCVLSTQGYLLNFKPLLFIAAGVISYNTLLMFYSRRTHVALWMIYLIILLDMCIITTAVHYMGGIEGPYFVLFPLVVFVEASYLRFDTCFLSLLFSLGGFSILAYNNAPFYGGTDYWILYYEKLFLLVLAGVTSLVYATRARLRATHIDKVIDNVGDILISIDKRAKCTFINHQGLELLGYKREEIQGKEIRDIFSEPGRFDEFFKYIFMQHQVSSSMTVISKTGEKIPILWHGIPFRPELGIIREVMLVGRDFREKIRLQEEVERKTDELARLYEIVAYEMSTISSSGQKIHEMMDKTMDIVFKALHAHACSIMLIDNEKKELYIIAGHGLPIHPTSDLRLAIGKGVAGWVAEHGEILNIPETEKDEKFISAEGVSENVKSLLCVPLASGQKVLGVINVSRKEVYPFTEAEAEILSIIASRAALSIENANIMQELEEEKVMLDRILNMAGEAIICLDHNKKISFVNQKGADMLGWSIEEMIGMNFCKDLAKLRNLQGKLLCQTNCILDKACYSESKIAHSEAMLMTKEGKDISIEANYSAITDSSGQLAFGVISIHDISERKKADRLRVQLTSNIVHELRTPLTYMRGYVDLLLMGRMGALTGEQTSSLGIVRESIFRLISLIDNLLEVARMEEGRFYLNFSKVSIRSILQKIVNLAKAEGSRKNIEINLVNSDKLPNIYADDKRISEIFINLLSNALKFTPSEGRVDINCSADDEFITISVKDTGAGIAEDHLHKIFTRFSQIGVNEIGKPGEGAGLGLNIVKRITEAHGGKTWVESELGKGTVFFIKLPRRDHAIK